MPRTRYTLALLLLALAGPALRAQAVPTTLSYQGVLTDAAGTPVPDGTYAVALRLFTAASGGSATYAESHTVSTVGGVFAAELGAGTPTTGTWANVTFDKGYWLETAVGGATLSPRTKLLAVPYARGLSLPYTASVGLSGSLLHLTNTAGSGLRGESASATGAGVWGEATSATGVSYGGFFRAASTSGQAVYAQATAASGSTYGVRAQAASSDGTGVYGSASASSGTTYGVHGSASSTNGRGVFGEATAATGTSYGGYFMSQSTTGRGAYALVTAATGLTYGVFGGSASSSGRGVYGEASATSGTTSGVNGVAFSTSGSGVYGVALATSGAAYGVHGTSNSTFGRGVFGEATATSGNAYGGDFRSASTSGRGVYAVSTATSGATLGVYGVVSSPDGEGVSGFAGAEGGTAIRGTHYFSSGYAGYFQGRVHVTGTLSKGGGSFVIDHPLDPEERLLRHSFVESPDMMNVYNGNVVTDERGYATVTLPEWFEALNRDFRYQLTPIGSFSRAMIAEEVRGNRFVIRTEEPGVRVSWQVTGVRQDAWAEENRIVVEEEKPAEQRGRYLHPSAFGQPRARGVDYNPELEAEWARFEEERARQEAERAPHDAAHEAERHRLDAVRTERGE